VIVTLGLVVPFLGLSMTFLYVRGKLHTAEWLVGGCHGGNSEAGHSMTLFVAAVIGSIMTLYVWLDNSGFWNSQFSNQKCIFVDKLTHHVALVSIWLDILQWLVEHYQDHVYTRRLHVS
jgi:hypothetical protein